MESLSTIRRAQNGDQEAYEAIFEKYSNIIEYSCKKYFLYGGDKEDVHQEASYGMLKAIRGYKEGNNAKFATFATLCIKRHLISKFNHFSGNKHRVLNLAMGDLSGDLIGEDIFERKKILGNSPEDILMAKERKVEIGKIYRRIMSKTEKTVFEKLLEGRTYIEIAHELNLKPKSVDNTIQRVKNKIRNYQI